MKSQPKPDYQSNDDIQTPQVLAQRLCKHFLCSVYDKDSNFQHTTRFLEPCIGDGHFYHAAAPFFGTSRMNWCEVKVGRDFYDYQGHADWIITNPPWSLLKAAKGRIRFLEKAFQVADNVVFLCTLNHLLGLRARYRLMDRYGFGIKEVVLLETPATPWPASGFQVGAVHYQKGCSGMVQWTDLRKESDCP